MLWWSAEVVGELVVAPALLTAHSSCTGGRVRTAAGGSKALPDWRPPCCSASPPSRCRLNTDRWVWRHLGPFAAFEPDVTYQVLLIQAHLVIVVGPALLLTLVEREASDQPHSSARSSDHSPRPSSCSTCAIPRTCAPTRRRRLGWLSVSRSPTRATGWTPTRSSTCTSPSSRPSPSAKAPDWGCAFGRDVQLRRGLYHPAQAVHAPHAGRSRRRHLPTRRVNGWALQGPRRALLPRVSGRPAGGARQRHVWTPSAMAWSNQHRTSARRPAGLGVR